MPTAEVTLPGLTSSVPTARHFAESVLMGWGEPEAAWTAAQVVSELATNCTIHARTDFSVRISVEERRVQIEVRDASPVTVRPRSYSDTATTGRGLRMVATMAAAWGVALTEDGKTVWVRLEPVTGEDDDDTADLETLLEAFSDGDAGTAPPSPRGGDAPALRAA